MSVAPLKGVSRLTTILYGQRVLTIITHSNRSSSKVKDQISPRRKLDPFQTT